MGTTQERNILYSTKVAECLGLELLNREYNYGKGIGQADNHCYQSEWHIIFEIEYRQRHPEFNVSKVWPYLEKHTDQKVLLIHFITDAKKVSANRLIHSEWIAKKMIDDLKGRFDYYMIKNDICPTDIEILKRKIDSYKTSS